MAFRAKSAMRRNGRWRRFVEPMLVFFEGSNPECMNVNCPLQRSERSSFRR